MHLFFAPRQSCRFIAPILFVLLVLGGCARPQAETPDKGKARPAAAQAAPRQKGPGPGGPASPTADDSVPVEIAPARIGPIADYIEYNSTLEVETAVTLHPETAGLVESLLVEEGDRVKAGQPLLLLEHNEQQVELLESEANLKQAETRFQRTADLFKRGLVNQQDFDTASFQLEQARLRLERARIRMDQTTARAPVDGVITERFVQPGARVTASTALFELMSLDDMIARVYVPGRHLTVVEEGQPAYLTSEFLPGRRFEGWVKRISPVVDPASGTFKVTVGVVPGDNPPPPGLFVKVRIITDRKENAVLVPRQAVVYEGSERYVFVVDGDRARKVRLDAGYEEDDYIEAQSGIKGGEPIVVVGQNTLKDQARVRIVNENGPAPAAAVLDNQTPAAAAGS